MRSNFYDVGAFHVKFDWPNSSHVSVTPHPLSPDVLRFRLKFILEETAEYAESQGVTALAEELRRMLKPRMHPDPDQREDLYEVKQPADLAEGADALIDLAYVVMGTAHHHGFAWQRHWDEVQRANLERVPGVSKRGVTGYDVVKPPGWLGPDHATILREQGVEL